MTAAPSSSAGKFPSEGFLVLPNRLEAPAMAELDKLLGGRRVLYLVEENAVFSPQVKMRLDHGKALSFADTPESLAALKVAVDSHLAGNGAAVYVPGRVHVRRGTLLHGSGVAYSRLLLLGTPAVPVFADHPAECAMSIESPRHYPGVHLAVGPVLRGVHCSLARFQEEMLLLWESVFSTRRLLDGHLAYALLQGLKKHGGRAAIFDGMDGSRTGYDQILAAAIVLSLRIREWTDKPRVGIVLPPGRAGLIANIATLFAGKTPVNLNYTAGKESVESCIRQAGIDRYLTVDAFVRRMQKFPWPRNRDLIFLERELPAMKPAIMRWYVLAKVLPSVVLAHRIGIPRKGGRDEAVLLFTSGSSGEPKGVPLSHRNVLANTSQFAARLDMNHEDALLGCLPLFHSFGCTVTLWFPVIEGINLVTFPSPLEVDKLAALIHDHKVSLMVTTPTFLRGFLKKAKSEQLASLKLVITGAEKLPGTLADMFEKRFGHRVLEGYGLTETSPATNFNLPNLPVDADNLPVHPSHRSGSAGQFVPGLAVRVTDPATDEVLPPDRSGIIWFKGANVFEGYLNWGAKNREIVQDGWFRTGDIGRIDEDGFLYIEGRLSRFSKIGGEMVPHERVEEYVTRALGLESEDVRKIVVVGVPDPAKGEALILLSTIAGEYLEQEMIDLRYRLLAMNVPALWIPRKMVRVPDIPTLASGKLDMRGCEALAKQTLGM